MPGNLSTLSTLFQDKIEPGIKNQLNSSAPWLQMYKAMGTKDWTGTKKVIKVRVNRNRGSYFAPEGGAIPDAGQQRLEDLNVEMRFHYGNVSLTEQVIKFSRGQGAAAASALEFELEGLVDDMRIQRSFAMNTGFGLGIRALLNGEPGTDTRAEVDSPGGVAGANNGVRYLNEGDFIVAVEPASGTIRAGGTREILAIDPEGNFFDVDSAIDASWADNDQIVKASGSNASIAIENTDYNHAPLGNLGLFDDGTFVNNYFAINRTSFPIMRSFVLADVGALSADAIMRSIHAVMQVGRGRVKYHWMHPDTLRSYIAMTKDDRRYTAGELMTPDAGTSAADQSDESNSGLKFGNVPIHIDLDLPYGMWFGIDNRACKRYVGDSGSWVNRDGAVFTRSTTALDTYTAQYRLWEQNVNFQPNQSFRMDGIASNVVVVHRV